MQPQSHKDIPTLPRLQKKKSGSPSKCVLCVDLCLRTNCVQMTSFRHNSSYSRLISMTTRWYIYFLGNIQLTLLNEILRKLESHRCNGKVVPVSAMEVYGGCYIDSATHS